MSQEQEARASLARTEEQRAAAESDAKTLAIKEQHLERLAGALVRALRKDELARRLKSFEEAAKNLTEIDAQLLQVRIKPKTVEDIDELDRQIAALDAQLSAAAATLTVEVKPAGAGEVHIGSLRAKGSQAMAVLTPTKVTVGDLAPLTTWLIDEADNLDLHRQSNGVVRSVLNMGHTRGATVCRMVKGEPLKIKVFAPLAVAAIGTLPFPLLRRSISINMQRPTADQKLERIDDTSPEWAASRHQIERWARRCSLAPDPVNPPQLRNRAADNWRALLAIADDLGHGEAARAAAVKLSANRVYTEPGVALLGDVLLVFQEKGVDRLTSKELVAGLLELNDGDWNEWRGPKEDQTPHRLTQSELAAMLRPFHIRPRTIWPKGSRSGSRSSRGYLKASFQRAWDSYCRDDTPTQPSKIIPLDREVAA
jgi:hypothetical protein